MYKQLFKFAILSLPLVANAQRPEGLVASYSFNRGRAESEVGPNDVRAVGATPTEDRFGNSNSAYYLHGNPNSYLSLGTDTILKPATATISLWFKMDNFIFGGRGAPGNPILVTKTHAGEDFNEAYYIGCNHPSKRISGVMENISGGDSIQFALRSNMPVELSHWYHVAMCYNDSFILLYVDGVLQNQVAKGFRTTFLPSDSVMVGNSASVKNLRFFNGSVDDIEIYNRVLSPAEIMTLYKAPDPDRLNAFMKKFLLVLLIAVGAGLVAWLFIRRYKNELHQERERNTLQQRIYEMEMRVMKVQMNPHFIFNALNSLKQLVLKEETQKAGKYLDKFSGLLRKTLESNTDEYITVQDEIDMLSRYIELEALRFDRAFAYEISSDTGIIVKDMRIPQMLIQPVVENAIWHGLLPKNGNKNLHITFCSLDEKRVSCIIEDNGIGRNAKKITPVPLKERSLAISFISQRLMLMQKEWGESYGISIEDKTDEQGSNTGTKVTLIMPLLRK